MPKSPNAGKDRSAKKPLVALAAVVLVGCAQQAPTVMPKFTAPPDFSVGDFGAERQHELRVAWNSPTCVMQAIRPIDNINHDEILWGLAVRSAAAVRAASPRADTLLHATYAYGQKYCSQVGQANTGRWVYFLLSGNYSRAFAKYADLYCDPGRWALTDQTPPPSNGCGYLLNGAARASFRTGLVLAREGRYGQAETELIGALRKSNSNPVELMDVLGSVYLADDRRADALAMWRRVLGQEPTPMNPAWISALVLYERTPQR